MFILIIILIVFAILVYYGFKKQDKMTKAQFLNDYGSQEFERTFGKKELKKLTK